VSGAFFVPGSTFWQNTRTMEIEYELTEIDFADAFAAHRKGNSAASRRLVIVFWIGIAFSSYVLYGAIRTHNALRLLPLMLLAILWITLVEVFPRRNMRRQYAQQPSAHGPRQLVLDASGAHWRWNGDSADVEWRNYIRTVEGPDQILLYTSPACFNILPKRVLTIDQLSKLRVLLLQNIQTR